MSEGNAGTSQGGDVMKADYAARELEMKSYEKRDARRLDWNEPVIIRVDGRAFATYTQGFQKPFDEVFRRAMAKTMLDLCAEVPDTLVGYTFSDEISLILFPQDVDVTSRWFGYNIQKIVSVAASCATLRYNVRYAQEVEAFKRFLISDYTTHPTERFSRYMAEYLGCLDEKLAKATFDARAYNLPVSKLKDYLLYRQGDCIRNSLQAVERSNMERLRSATNSIYGLQMDMSWLALWNDYPSFFRLGAFAAKKTEQHKKIINGEMVKYTRNVWSVLPDSPDLSKDFGVLNAWLPEV